MPTASLSMGHRPPIDTQKAAKERVDKMIEAAKTEAEAKKYDSDISEKFRNGPNSMDQQIVEQYTKNMKVQGNVSIGKVKDVASTPNWIKEINPMFNPYDYNSPFSKNCGSCALAVYRRLEGDSSAHATEKNIGQVYQMELLTGMKQVTMTPNQIQDKLLKAGDGAHAIIGIDRVYGSGHWFNAVNIGGKVYAVDGQTGRIQEWPPDYGKVAKWDMSMK